MLYGLFHLLPTFWNVPGGTWPIDPLKWARNQPHTTEIPHTRNLTKFELYVSVLLPDVPVISILLYPHYNLEYPRWDPPEVGPESAPLHSHSLNTKIEPHHCSIVIGSFFPASNGTYIYLNLSTKYNHNSAIFAPPMVDNLHEIPPYGHVIPPDVLACRCPRTLIRSKFKFIHSQKS